MPNSLPGRVMVTGASGTIGNNLVNALVEAGIETVALDQKPNPPHRANPHTLTTHFASINDRAALSNAMVGVNQVVHLAANPNSNADLESLLVGPNIIGLKNVLDAAHLAQVRRVVLASSIQVTREGDRPHPAGLAHQQCHNWYAITKAMAEHAGEMYHLQHGIDVLAVRIGWHVPQPQSPGDRPNKSLQYLNAQRYHDKYLSPDDAARFFVASVTSEWSGFHVLNAMSKPLNPDDPEYDLHSARELIGYEPKDLLPEPLAESDA